MSAGESATPSLVVTVASHVPRATCRECGDPLPNRHTSDSDLEDHVNHYLAHGYLLLHVGAETREQEGRVLHHTVAVLARPRDLPGEPAGKESTEGLTMERLAGGSLRHLFESGDG
ncbi:MAG: hypothetical protein ACRELC_01215 [Gemmatimonadota bacterium]